MATAAVLRPHDCLIGPKIDRFFPNPNPNPNLRRRKRCPTKSPAKPQISGHVTILRRGEVLPSPPPSEKMVVYAGAAMVVASPPPSSLPFPAFCRQTEEKNSVATCHIRWMLGLDRFDPTVTI